MHSLYSPTQLSKMNNQDGAAKNTGLPPLQAPIVRRRSSQAEQDTSFSHPVPINLLPKLRSCECGGSFLLPRPHSWAWGSYFGHGATDSLGLWLPCLSSSAGGSMPGEASQEDLRLLPTPSLLSTQFPSQVCHSDRRPLSSPSASELRLRDFAWGKRQAEKQIALSF